MPLAFENGLWWPVGDRHCRPALERQFRDVERALKHVRGRMLCVQAGGNCGIWPSYLSGKFDEVWTIEADFTNYRCLVRNIAGLDNVCPIWGALSNVSGKAVAMKCDPSNIGAHHIDVNSSAENAVTLTIDELELEACDLIQLDIEGHEPIALEGARETIRRFLPVIMVEDNGSCARYGVPAKWEQTFPGYRVVDAINRDVILVPC